MDAAIVDGTAVLTTMIHGMLDGGVLGATGAGVNLLDTGAPFYDVYRCADGQFVAVGALEEQFYAALLDGLGLAGDETLPDRERPPPVAGAAGRGSPRCSPAGPAAEWWSVFAGTDACVAPVWSLLEATERPAQPGARGVRRGRRRACSPPSPRGSRPRPARSAGCPRWGSTTTEIRAELGL